MFPLSEWSKELSTSKDTFIVLKRQLHLCSVEMTEFSSLKEDKNYSYYKLNKCVIGFLFSINTNINIFYVSF